MSCDITHHVWGFACDIIAHFCITIAMSSSVMISLAIRDLNVIGLSVCYIA